MTKETNLKALYIFHCLFQTSSEKLFVVNVQLFVYDCIVVFFRKRKIKNHKTSYILKMKAHFEREPHFENESSFWNPFWKWKLVLGNFWFITIFQVMMAQMTTTMMTRIQSLTCTWVIKWLVHPCFKIVFFIIWTPQLLKWTTMLSFPTWYCYSTSWFAMMFSAMMHTSAP